MKDKSEKQCNIAYCMPTCNRAKLVDEVLKKCISMFEKYGIDVYIYDSSSDDETEKIAKKNSKYKNLYYRRMPYKTYGFDKIKLMFMGVDFNKDYDYIWLIKDRVYPSEEIITRIIDAADNNPDAIFLRAIETTHTVDLTDDHYVDPVKFYHDWAWLVTSWDCTLLNRKNILCDLNWDKIMDKYSTDNTLCYPIVAILFTKLAESKKCNISVLMAEKSNTIINIPINKSIDDDVFRVWGYNWHYANMNLPDIYNDEKEFVIKSGTSLPWIIGDQLRLMEIWKNGCLTDDKLECVKDIWSEISNIPWDDVCRIKDGDMAFMKKCFTDLVWEQVSNSNMNQVLHYYSKFQWLNDNSVDIDFQNTIYMIEIYLYELQNENVHIFDGGITKEFVFEKIQLAINFIRLLEECDNVQNKEFKAVIKNKIISVSMMEYLIVKLCKNTELVVERFNKFITGGDEQQAETVNTAEKDSLYFYRKQVLDAEKERFDATIVVVAYNRPDITRLCVESVLRNTGDVKYKLILIYNKSDYGDGILEYFNSVLYENKVVIELDNNGAPYAYRKAEKYFEGNYIVHLPNDVIVTPNWLSNMIKCAKSDPLIGMVNPKSSNVSNFQDENIEFNNYDEMQAKAQEYNVSDKVKWHERLRLITLATLFTRECLAAVGPIFDIGFIHDFGDDDISFRVRRAGYKAVLAGDTWVHHAHDVFNMESKDPEKCRKSFETGRKNFKDKYFGIDAWEDLCNYVFPYIDSSVNSPVNVDDVNVLGIDVKCGTPLLDIKNIIRKYNAFNPSLSAFTTDSKYVIDLKTICNSDVVCDRFEYLNDSFENDKFDYIIAGNSINTYRNPRKAIRELYSMLRDGGQLFLNLKNTYSIMTFTNMLGYNIGTDENYEHINIDSLFREMKNDVGCINLINCEHHNIDGEVLKYVLQVMDYAGVDKIKEDLSGKLMVDKYWIKISK